MRIQKLGKFNFFTSYMSQPKFQLETFKAWAGLGSDISYYLNSHHIDLHVWAMEVIISLSLSLSHPKKRLSPTFDLRAWPDVSP